MRMTERMVMAARIALDAIGEMDKFVSYRDFQRTSLHVWLDEDQMAMAWQGELHLSGSEVMARHKGAARRGGRIEFASLFP